MHHIHHIIYHRNHLLTFEIYLRSKTSESSALQLTRVRISFVHIILCIRDFLAYVYAYVVMFRVPDEVALCIVTLNPFYTH